MIEEITSRKKSARIFEWLKLITITGSAQIIIQLVGIVSGIIVVRSLSTDEYALYTIANTMLGTMVILADGGITTGVMSLSAKSWQDREKLGSILASGLYLRKIFAIITLTFAVPVLYYFLNHHGASTIIAFLIICSLIVSFYANLSGNLLEILPKLNQNIVALQITQLTNNFLRLFLLSVLLLFLPLSVIAIFAGGIPQIITNKKLNVIANTYANISSKPNPIIIREILRIVKLRLPDAIYYCLSGQITIWLISIFGSTTSIADLGALSRISMLFNLFSILFATLVIPRYARIADDFQILRVRSLQILILLLFLTFLIFIITNAFTNQILLVLGQKYMHLGGSVPLMIFGGSLNLISGVLFGLCTSRGWIFNPILSIIINLIASCTGIFFFKIQILEGVLLFNIYICSIQVLSYLFFLYLNLRRFTYNI